MSEDKNYEVNDRRKVKLDENGDAVIQQDDDQSSEINDVQEELEQHIPDMNNMPPVDVYSVIKSFISILSSQTWLWLGLFKNPTTGKLETDLQQARVAIDIIAVLIEKVNDNSTPAEQRELRDLINDLRMNFVRQNTKGK